MIFFNKKRSNRRQSISLTLVLAIFLAILSFSHIKVKAAESIVIKVDTQKYTLSQAKNIIEKYYIDKVPDQALNSTSIEEMVKALNDPYSRYFHKEEFQSFVNSIDNRFCGIGIRLIMTNKGIKVTEAIKGSPAEEVGIKANDIIVKADDNKLEGLSAKEALKFLKGKKGTSVKLLVKRENKYLTFNVVRKEISLPTVVSKVINNSIGYIRISSFGENTPGEFRNSLEKLEKSNVKSYIIDLRYNHGGYVNSAIDIGGYFLEDNPVMIMENNKGKRTTFNGMKHNIKIDKPIIVLINEESASASEILAGALKDYKTAFFIGKTTYGKGVAQRMFTLIDKSALKLTTNKFFTPYGKVINKVGINPDFKISDDKINSLKVASLLFSNWNTKGSIEALNNKEGFAKVTIDDSIFYIDLKEARKQENWDVYRYIINNVEKENIYLGNKDGWINYNNINVKNELKGFYPNVKVLKDIEKVSKDNIFTMTFNEKLDKKLIDNTKIEIINSLTGERIPFEIQNKSNNMRNKIIIKTKEELNKGVYYLGVISLEKDFKDVFITVNKR